MFGCGVCLVNSFFICCFHKVYFCLEGGTFKSYNSRAIDSIPIKIGQSLDEMILKKERVGELDHTFFTESHFCAIALYFFLANLKMLCNF